MWLSLQAKFNLDRTAVGSASSGECFGHYPNLCMRCIMIWRGNGRFVPEKFRSSR
ncbi:hypothetical protein LINGRAHAP2_LOCUS2350 [Linum grandiflorum]